MQDFTVTRQSSCGGDVTCMALLTVKVGTVGGRPSRKEMMKYRLDNGMGFYYCLSDVTLALHLRPMAGYRTHA